jgi:Mycotoxin biosynthesis protein UstYa
MWPEYYYPNMTQLELEELKFHNGSLPLLFRFPFSVFRCPFSLELRSKPPSYLANPAPYAKDHCLDTLRQSIMCHADISLITMRWGHLQPIPLGNFSAPHECIDWRSLDGWSEARAVDVMRPGWLKHPVLGPSFPTGRGVRTGVGHDS